MSRDGLRNVRDRGRSLTSKGERKRKGRRRRRGEMREGM